VLAKTTTTTAQEGVAAAAATTTPIPTTWNQEESIVDKPKGKETVKAEPCSASSYLTREQYNKNFNNPTSMQNTNFSSIYCHCHHQLKRN
jgi:hypothetical protein